MFTQQLEVKSAPATNFSLPKIRRSDVGNALGHYRERTQHNSGFKNLRQFYHKLDKKNNFLLDINQLCELLKIISYKPKEADHYAGYNYESTPEHEMFAMLKVKFDINSIKMAWQGIGELGKRNSITPAYLMKLYETRVTVEAKAQDSLSMPESAGEVVDATMSDAKPSAPVVINKPLSEVFEFLNRDESLAGMLQNKKRSFSCFEENTNWKELTEKRFPEECKAIQAFYPDLKETKDDTTGCTFYHNPTLFWRVAYFVLPVTVERPAHSYSCLRAGEATRDWSQAFLQQFFTILLLTNDLYGIKRSSFDEEVLDRSFGEQCLQNWALKFNRQEILDSVFKTSSTSKGVICHQPVDVIIKNTMDHELGDLLADAVKYSHSELVKYLVKNCKPLPGQTTICPPHVLNIAVKLGDVSIVKCLIEEGHADPLLVGSSSSERYDEYDTPLSLVAKLGNLEMIRYFVEGAKVDLHKPDKSLAAAYQERNDLDVLRIFRHAPEPCGTGMVVAAATAGHFGVVKYLIEDCKVSADPKNPASFSALKKVIENRDDRYHNEMLSDQDQLNMVKYLVSQKADVEGMFGFFDPFTPLHCAAQQQLLDIVKFLVNEGHANVNAIDGFRGNTALQLAEQTGHHAEDLPAITAFLKPLISYEQDAYAEYLAEQKQKAERALAEVNGTEDVEEASATASCEDLIKELGLESAMVKFKDMPVKVGLFGLSAEEKAGLDAEMETEKQAALRPF